MQKDKVAIKLQKVWSSWWVGKCPQIFAEGRFSNLSVQNSKMEMELKRAT